MFINDEINKINALIVHKFNETMIIFKKKMKLIKLIILKEKQKKTGLI